MFQKFIVVGPSNSDSREPKFFNSIFVCTRMHSKSNLEIFYNALDIEVIL